MAYVYRHIRLDKNVPFYIGVGSDSAGKYTRAYHKNYRETHWKNIANKGGYEVEILLDDLSWEAALQKEIEFIALYKRTTEGGTLCNKTLGGGGAVGVIVSEETRRKQSLKKKGKSSPNKGVPLSPEQAARFNATKKGRVSPMKGKQWPKEVREKMRLAFKPRFGKDNPNFGKPMKDEVKIKLALVNKGKSPPNKGVPMDMEVRLRMTKECQRKFGKPVLQFTKEGVFVKEHSSTCGAAKEMGGFDSGIRPVCQGKRGSYKGFVWRYKKEARSKNNEPLSSLT